MQGRCIVYHDLKQRIIILDHGQNMLTIIGYLDVNNRLLFRIKMHLLSQVIKEISEIFELIPMLVCYRAAAAVWRFLLSQICHDTCF